MNRDPSTEITPVKPSGILPPVGHRRAVFDEVMAAGREAFPQIEGLVYVDLSHAFFQRVGDATLYSVTVTTQESHALGYLGD